MSPKTTSQSITYMPKLLLKLNEPQNPIMILKENESLFVCVGVLKPSQQRGHVEPLS